MALSINPLEKDIKSVLELYNITNSKIIIKTKKSALYTKDLV